MKSIGIIAAASAAFSGFLLATGASYADTLPLILDPSLPGVVQPRITDGLANVFNFDNSVGGVVSSQTTTKPGSTAVTTATTYSYSRTYEKAQSATDLAGYINGLNSHQLTSIQTSAVTGSPSSSTTHGAATAGPVITLTNLGASAQSFSETVYFHSQQFNTSLIGGVPGQGGTGVIATTLTNGVPGTQTSSSSSTGASTISTAAGAFSAPTLTMVPAAPNGHGTTKYVYTWTRTVTTTVTTPFTDLEVVKSTIQNTPATVAAFSNLSFSLVSAPNVWISAPAVNNAQGSFTASQFTDTIFSTNGVFVGADNTVQYLMLPNNGTPALPTLYPIAHADEYAFVISGTLAPYSTGQLQLSVSAVPEVSTWGMMLVGFAGLGLASYRAARKSAALPA